MSEDNKIIVVTGFGPFGDHVINASWEAVKLLPEQFEEYQIVKKEIPVSYMDVDERIPDMWKSLNPQLVIHVGVSGEARKITIEKAANRIGYKKLDCYGKKHITGDVCPSNLGEDCINTGINVADVCDMLNKNGDVMEFCSSENAGRYLCEYIYYTSLRFNKSRCIFVHVPPLDEPYSATQLSDGIIKIIDCVLKQNFSSSTTVCQKC